MKYKYKLKEQNPLSPKVTLLDTIRTKLDNLNVEYKMDLNNKVEPFKVIYKPVNKSDDWYDKFNDIIWRYNLEKVVKTQMKENIDSNDSVLMKMRSLKDKNSQNVVPKKDPNSEKIEFLKRKRDEIMRDMEQEAEPEGGPIADRYGDELNKIDKAISKLTKQNEWGPETNPYMSPDEIEKRAKNIREFEENDPIDILTMDIPLFIRLLEYSREDAQNDMDLHFVTENLLKLSKEKGILSMEDYQDIIGKKTDELKEENTGLWDNIRAKRERGEKPSPKGSKAYKKAVSAGKKINKEK